MLRLIPNWGKSSPGCWDLAAQGAFPLPLPRNGRWSRNLWSTNLSTVFLQSGIAQSPEAPCCAALETHGSNQTSALAEPPTMAISKHSFAPTRYRFTSQQIWNYQGDEIPTRSAAKLPLFVRNTYTQFWRTSAITSSHFVSTYCKRCSVPFNVKGNEAENDVECLSLPQHPAIVQILHHSG